MGSGGFRWFMLRQCLPQCSPQAIPDFPPARVIRGEDPQCLLGFLGLAVSVRTTRANQWFPIR